MLNKLIIMAVTLTLLVLGTGTAVAHHAPGQPTVYWTTSWSSYDKHPAASLAGNTRGDGHCHRQPSFAMYFPLYYDGETRTHVRLKFTHSWTTRNRASTVRDSIYPGWADIRGTINMPRSGGRTTVQYALQLENNQWSAWSRPVKLYCS